MCQALFLNVLHVFTPLIVPITYEVNNCDYYLMSHRKSLNGVKQGKEIRFMYENFPSGSSVEHWRGSEWMLGDSSGGLHSSGLGLDARSLDLMGGCGGGEKWAYLRVIQGETWRNCLALPQHSAQVSNKLPLLQACPHLPSNSPDLTQYQTLGWFSNKQITESQPPKWTVSQTNTLPNG